MSSKNPPSDRAPSLRSRLNKLVFIAFLPMAAALLADALLSRMHALADARQKNIEEATLAAAYQEKHHAYVRALLVTIASDYEDGKLDRQTCGKQLQTLLGKLERFSNIGLLDADGRLVCSGLPGAPGTSFAFRRYFQEARDRKELAASELTTGVLSGQRLVIFGFPLMDAGRRFDGVVFATFQDKHFASLPPAQERDVSSHFAYFDRDGKFIATDPPDSAARVDDLSAERLRQLRASNTPLAFEDRDGTGRKRIVAVAAVGTTPQQARVAYVLAVLDENQVLAAWRAAVLRKAGGLALALLIGVAVARLLLEKWLIADLRKLVGFTGAVRQGQKPEPPTAAQSEETAIALNSVVAMADTLRQQRAELLQLHDQVSAANIELEQRVQDRTRELQRSERLYRALAEAIPQMVWSGTPEQGITYVNRAWQSALGGPSSAALGHAWIDYFHPDERARAMRLWHEASQNNGVFAGQFTIGCRDGQYRHYMLRCAPVVGADGRVELWAGVGTDITELKKTEDALRLANSELQSFSYSVSHDLRAPLNAINGFAGVLLSDFGDELSPQVHHYMERIQASSRHMSVLIDDLLKLAQLSAADSRLTNADLSAICNEVVASLREAEPARAVTVDIEPGMQAQADARLLRVAVSNLLGNAWKFTRQRRHARIEIGRLMQDGETVFYVKDNGIGFDMRYADKLFGVFQRLHSNREFPGTGIGLATVRRVIARHHGRIWSEARPNEGAVFYFTIGAERRQPQSADEQQEIADAC
jgi:PAS domain S-box-containing protein